MDIAFRYLMLIAQVMHYGKKIRKTGRKNLEMEYKMMSLRWCPAPESSTGSAKRTDNVTGCAPSVPGTRRLHIGGTVEKQGWEVLNAVSGPHVDHMGNAADLSMFADETFSEIYSSNVLEHFDYVNEVPGVLKEWHRVLNNKGLLYVSVPDMDRLCELFLMKDALSLQESFHVMRMIFGGHTDQYDYHAVGLNLEFLVSYLTEAGFTRCRNVSGFGMFGDTSDLTFHNIPISVNIVCEKEKTGR